MRDDAAAAHWVASFYTFQPNDDLCALREALYRACIEQELKGTVLIAPEGVNVALTGLRLRLRDFIETHFPGVVVNWARVPPGTSAFQRLKVRERAEIVTCGRQIGTDTPVGRHVAPTDWNALLADRDVLLLDVRNRYETAIGTFPDAIAVATDNFREFADFADRELAGQRRRRVAMFCTGGIRCEKASAHLLANGFRDVCQLRGGILNYFANVPTAENAFVGECFVFDGRVSVATDGTEGSYRLCRTCGEPTPKGAGCVCAGCRKSPAAWKNETAPPHRP